MSPDVLFWLAVVLVLVALGKSSTHGERDAG